MEEETKEEQEGKEGREEVKRRSQGEGLEEVKSRRRPESDRRKSALHAHLLSRPIHSLPAAPSAIGMLRRHITIIYNYISTINAYYLVLEKFWATRPPSSVPPYLLHLLLHHHLLLLAFTSRTLHRDKGNI